MGKVGKIIVYVVLVLVLITGIGLIVKFTDGLSGEFKTFYITIDEKDIMGNEKDYVFEYGSPLKVDVHYTFEKVTNAKKDYSVKVIPNKVEGEDFDFMLNGEAYSFQMEEDLTAGFVIDKQADHFTITPKEGLEGILKGVYPDAEIVVDETKSYDNMFTLVVTSYNGEASVSINFMLSSGVYEITFDKETIRF